MRVFNSARVSTSAPRKVLLNFPQDIARKDSMIINAIIYFGVWMLALQVWESFKNRGDLAAMLLGLRPRHLGWGALLIFTTLLSLGGMATLVAASGAEWMTWSWLSALLSKDGSMITAAAQTPSTVPKSVIYAFYALLILALPMAALGEEKLFRRGAEKRSLAANAGIALVFALAHMVVGFPVFAALALFPLGMWLTHYYRISWRRSGGDSRVALLEAGRIHLANNMVALGTWAILVNAVKSP